MTAGRDSPNQMMTTTDDFTTLKQLGKEGQAVYDLFFTIPQ